MNSEAEGNRDPRRHLSNVAALLTLSARWHGYAPTEIASGLLDTLVRLLRLESAHIRMDGAGWCSAIEAWRPQLSSPPNALVRASRVAPMAPEFLQPAGSGTVTGPTSVVDGPVRVTYTPSMFPGATGIVLTGARRPHDPTEHERFLLGVAFDQAVVAIRGARLVEHEQAARTKAEAAVQDRDELLTAASHDLKNPLTAIKGQAQLLLHQARTNPSGQEETTRLEAIVAQAERMRRLVDRLLDLSRVQVGETLPLEVAVVDLVALVERLVGLYRVSGHARQFLIGTDAQNLVGA
jgi:signal transduction histidine kinase